MNFVKENVLDYIKRTVMANNSDPANRMITRVELTPNEWDELTKSYAVPRNSYSIRLAVMPTMMSALSRVEVGKAVEYQEVVICMVRKETDDDF